MFSTSEEAHQRHASAAHLHRPDQPGQRATSRYATRDEAMSPEFMEINSALAGLSAQYLMPDHAGVNQTRFPWAPRMPPAEFYASRLWEYPWAITSAELSTGLECADVGCGQSPFTVALRDIYGCSVTPIDPEYDEMSGNYYAHGVNPDFEARTGLEFVRAGIEKIPAADNSYDRVFCISVIEHIPRHSDVVAGIREVARILRPGGLAVVSVDIGLKKRIVNPLELVWESGLDFAGSACLTMPTERFGINVDGANPADVFGMVLSKSDGILNTEYGGGRSVISSEVARLRDELPPEWPDQVFHRWEVDRGVVDWYRDRNREGQPTLRTAFRMLAKTILGRYKTAAGSAGKH
jgi:2-polyprenyl-3-methyl-5-hydroxy-6-metoxy-1,4-benzoquinol methylase